MKAFPRCKLLTLWNGRLPDWFSKWEERWKQLDLQCFDWQLVRMDVSELRGRATKTLGVPCYKTKFYNCCDVRPMWGLIFADLLDGYDWWGWCDLDVVLGDLDGMLAPLLYCYDVVSTEFYNVAGGLAMMRNNDACNNLFRRRHCWEEILCDPGYQNFDEKGMTDLVFDSELCWNFDDRSWSEGRNMENGRPSRTCTIVGRDLIEVPTFREIALYHFGSKKWPVVDNEIFVEALGHRRRNGH